MLLHICLVQLALMATSVSAFLPFYPEYKCIEDGACKVGASRRDAEDRESGVQARDTTTLKIKQRLPTDSLPHDVRMRRYLQRLDRKFESNGRPATKRGNTYNIVTAVPPTQAYSAGLDQDGTDFSYFTEVKFGSASTPLYMLVDTGASATWVMGSSCVSNACQLHNTYGPSNSNTYKPASGVLDISYGTGNVNGSVATDTVSFAGFSLTLSFGVASYTSDEFEHFPFDGIIGLALDPGSYPTVLESITSSKVLASNVFGVNINRNSDGAHDGEISFGAPDLSKFTGSLTYTSLSSNQGDWVIAADGVGVDGKSTGITGRTAYIDTGTSYIFIPPADAKALHALIPGAQLNDGAWYVPCTTTAPVQFAFSGVSYSVPSEDWVGGKSWGPLCESNIYPGTPAGASSWLLGDTFMKNVYTVFDADQKRIGFGAKKPSSQSSMGSSSATVSPAAPPPSVSGSLTSNVITTGPSPTGGNSESSKSNLTTTSGNSGSSGLNAAITSSIISPAAASNATSVPGTTSAVHGSAGSQIEIFSTSISFIFFITIAIVI